MAVPKLRFKEFDGDWANFNLGDISDIKTGPFGSTLHQKDYVEIGTPIITVEHLGEVGLTSQNLPLVSDEDKVRLKSYMLDEGDLAFSRVGSVDRCAIITGKEKGWLFSGRILRVRPNKKLVHSKNLMYALKTEDAKYRIRSVAVGQTMPSLNTEILKNFSINLSNSVEEQTKIASFLSVVDEKISQLTQKHALLTQYKQGMMQKLFSQQIRFKADDGSEFGEWEEVRLGNLVDLTSGFAFKSDFFSEDGNKLITPKNFTTTGKANFTDTNTKWTTEISDKKYICRPNDLLVLLTDLTQSCELLGKPILLSQDDGNVLLNQRIVKIIPNRKLEKPFLLYLLLTDDFHELIVSTASGTTVKHSSNKVLQNFHFYLPCLEEQTKIANFLSAIDQKIEVVAQQIEQAKTWKKGLLQQMFV